MFTSLAIFALLPASSLATVFVTNPVASSTFTAGQEATISWQDDGSSPSLEEFGAARVSIYVGNALQQTSLQTIVEDVNVATTSEITFTPDASIGPDSNEYFIRFESLNLPDAEAPQFPALAFSAKFNLAGMSGEFDDAVQAQIDGQSTAPIALPPSATSATSADSSAAPTSTSSRTTSSTASPSASAAEEEEEDTNAAVGLALQWPASLLAIFSVFALL